VSGLIDDQSAQSLVGLFQYFLERCRKKASKNRNNEFIMCLFKLFTFEYDKIR